jgi:RND superfamily putative drug exporter
MRRFASWTTSHRKTVIIGWIVALIGIGMIASSAGSAFTEEFSLPSSDSKDALDLLENRFPAQAGDVVQIVYKAESGVESPAVQRKMEGVFAKVVALPHVSEVSSPYEKGGAAATPPPSSTSPPTS